MTERPPGYYCGGKKRDGSGHTCHLRAGWGTLHVGRGKCKLHGGVSRADDGRLKRGGRYSQVLPAQLRERYEIFLEEAERVKDVAPEIALKRALLSSYLEPALERITNAMKGEGDFPLGDVAAILGWASEIEKGCHRLARIEAAGALTHAEIALVEMVVVDILQKYIESDEKRLQAVNELAWRLGHAAQESQERTLLLAEVENE